MDQKDINRILDMLKLLEKTLPYVTMLERPRAEFAINTIRRLVLSYQPDVLLYTEGD